MGGRESRCGGGPPDGSVAAAVDIPGRAGDGPDTCGAAAWGARGTGGGVRDGEVAVGGVGGGTAARRGEARRLAAKTQGREDGGAGAAGKRAAVAGARQPRAPLGRASWRWGGGGAGRGCGVARSGGWEGWLWTACVSACRGAAKEAAAARRTCVTAGHVSRVTAASCGLRCRGAFCWHVRKARAQGTCACRNSGLSQAADRRHSNWRGYCGGRSSAGLPCLSESPALSESLETGWLRRVAAVLRVAHASALSRHAGPGPGPRRPSGRRPRTA